MHQTWQTQSVPTKTYLSLNYELFQIYIHCFMILCNASDPTSRCARGCEKAAVSKRDVSMRGSESKQYLMTQGPLKRRDTLQVEGVQETLEGGMFFFLILFICLFVCWCVCLFVCSFFRLFVLFCFCFIVIDDVAFFN